MVSPVMSSMLTEFTDAIWIHSVATYFLKSKNARLHVLDGFKRCSCLDVIASAWERIDIMGDNPQNFIEVDVGDIITEGMIVEKI